jgi:hypothetical protein
MLMRIIPIGLLLLWMTGANAHPDDMLERIALVDTGYDLCLQTGGKNCSANKNLLFRGDQPIPDDAPFDFEFGFFQERALNALATADTHYEIHAPLPASLAELKNYRIVIINLLYDFKSEGSPVELADLENEFINSGVVTSLQIPEQHHLYGLDSAFRPDQYAFEWWPVELSSVDVDSPEFVSLSLNWPAKQKTPPHAFKPDVYRPLNFPALISGSTAFEESNPNQKSLGELLMTLPDDGHPLLIYYHCVAGKDRTGAVSTSYFMTYGGYPFILTPLGKHPRERRRQPLLFPQAFAAATIPLHPANPYSAKLGSAYCLFLGKSKEECDVTSLSW